MKRLLIVIMIAALALTVSVRQVNAADPPAGIRYAPPTVTLTTGKLSYAPGEAIDWRYTLYNGNDQPLVLTFTSGQTYDLILRQGRKAIARWSTGKMFTDVMSTRTVMMGETMELKGSWQLPAELALGTYDLEFVLTSTTTEPTGAQDAVRCRQGKRGQRRRQVHDGQAHLPRGNDHHGQVHDHEPDRPAPRPDLPDRPAV